MDGNIFSSIAVYMPCSCANIKFKFAFVFFQYTASNAAFDATSGLWSFGVFRNHISAAEIDINLQRYLFSCFLRVHGNFSNDTQL